MMFDLVARHALAVTYIALGVRAFWIARACARQRARVISTVAIGGLAVVWAAFWLATIILNPVLPPDQTTSTVAWLSRIVHIPQAAGIYMMLTLICDVERR